MEQPISTGLPGTSVSNVAQINYFNYSLNLVHHYTGLSWLDATTSAGFVRERRDLSNPVTIGYNLWPGSMRRRWARCSRTSTSGRAARPVAVWAGADHHAQLAPDADGWRDGGAVDERWRHLEVLRLSAVLGVVSSAEFVGFLDELKLRAAYGQSGNLGLYGAKYTPFNRPVDGRMDRGDPTAR